MNCFLVLCCQKLITPDAISKKSLITFNKKVFQKTNYFYQSYDKLSNDKLFLFVFKIGRIKKQTNNSYNMDETYFRI